MKFFRLLLLLLGLAGRLFAVVWVVPDSVSTIQAAVDTAVSGDTVLVMRTFQNGSPVRISGKRIVLLSNNYIKNPSSYNIATGAAIFSNDNTQPLLSLDHADSSVIKGFLLDRSGTQNGGGVHVGFSDGIIFESLHFRGNRLTLDNAELLVSNSQHYLYAHEDSAAIALHASDLHMGNVILRLLEPASLLAADHYSAVTSFNFVVYNNTCSSSLFRLSGAEMDLNFTSFYNNVFTAPAWDVTSSDITIANSILSHVPPDDPSQFEISYSAIPGEYPGIGNLSENPLIDPSVSYPALHATSPCISAANPDTSGIPRYDAMGKIRPNPDWAPPDMGAYESSRHMPLNDGHLFLVSPAGNDIWGNGTAGYPFAGVQAAVDYASGGDTVMMLPGTYRGSINIENKFLTLGSEFILNADTAYRDSVILLPDSNITTSVIMVRNTDSLALRGLTIKEGSGRFFFNNYTYGGGLYSENTRCFLERVSFSNNGAGFCGGGIYALMSSLTLYYVDLDHNSAYLGGAIGLSESKAHLAHVNIRHNTASSGGALYAENNSRLVAFFSDISFNTANSDSLSATLGKSSAISQYGGGVYSVNTDIRLHNVLLNNNISRNKGAAIACRFGGVSLVQSTIADNTCQSDAAGIVFLDRQSDPAIFLNTILWAPDDDAIECYSTKLSLLYSLVSGGINNILDPGSLSVITATNLMDSDPLFGENYSLTAGSPAINAGLDQYAQSGYHIINYASSDYEGAAPDLGFSGATPAVSFVREPLSSSVKTPPAHPELLQIYPNPFNPNTTLCFRLEKGGMTRLDVFNLHGRRVRTLLHSFLNTGVYAFDFDAGNLSSGVYLARLTQNGDLLSTHKMLLLK